MRKSSWLHIFITVFWQDCSDEDADQLAQLKTNVSDIRNELQAALMDEDTKMVGVSLMDIDVVSLSLILGCSNGLRFLLQSALAATTERHFPELILLHPDLGLREEIVGSLCTMPTPIPGTVQTVVHDWMLARAGLLQLGEGESFT